MKRPSRLPPPDPVIEAYKAGVDRTLIRENLRLTPAQRLEKHAAALALVLELRGAARRHRGRGVLEEREGATG